MFCCKPLVIKTEGRIQLVMKFGKWVRLATVVAMVLVCVVISKIIMHIFLIYFLMTFR